MPCTLRPAPYDPLCPITFLVWLLLCQLPLHPADKGDDPTCTDSKYYSLPYFKDIYEQKEGKTVYKLNNFSSRCEYYMKRKPCDSHYFKRSCGKECGSGTNAPHMNEPYEHIERVDPYKKKQYSSRCEYHKLRGRCRSDENRAQYEPTFKSPCQKTCTGEGTDAESHSKAYEGDDYKVTKFESRCAYYMKRAEEPCKQSLLKSRCQKTCTGEGQDSRYYTAPYTQRVPVFKETKKYATRCEYVKEAKKCGSSGGCRKTCNTCKVCKDYSTSTSMCKMMVSRGYCKEPRHERMAAQCESSCGLCSASPDTAAKSEDMEQVNLYPVSYTLVASPTNLQVKALRPICDAVTEFRAS